MVSVVFGKAGKERSEHRLVLALQRLSLLLDTMMPTRPWYLFIFFSPYIPVAHDRGNQRLSIDLLAIVLFLTSRIVALRGAAFLYAEKGASSSRLSRLACSSSCMHASRIIPTLKAPIPAADLEYACRGPSSRDSLAASMWVVMDGFNGSADRIVRAPCQARLKERRQNAGEGRAAT